MKFNILPSGNLELAIEDDLDREELQESYDKAQNHRDHGVLADLLEFTGWTPNGRLYQVAPESIGALTDAPILTDDMSFSDDGRQEVVGKVWWFPNYQVESFAETLIKAGRVVFTQAAS